MKQEKKMPLVSVTQVGRKVASRAATTRNSPPPKRRTEVTPGRQSNQSSRASPHKVGSSARRRATLASSKKTVAMDSSSSFDDERSEEAASGGQTGKSYFGRRNTKLVGMLGKMEQERLDQVRNLPLNDIRKSSLLQRNSSTNELRESVKNRILQNSDILDARINKQLQLASQEQKKSKRQINLSKDIVFKGAKLFNTNGGKLFRKQTIPQQPKLNTMDRAKHRESFQLIKTKQSGFLSSQFNRGERNSGNADLPSFAFKHPRKFSCIMRRNSPLPYMPSIHHNGSDRDILHNNFVRNAQASNVKHLGYKMVGSHSMTNFVNSTLFQGSASKSFRNPKVESSHVNHMHENTNGKRKESCEWCSMGTREHNWPEKRTPFVPPQAFHLSQSNYSHSQCKEETHRHKPVINRAKLRSKLKKVIWSQTTFRPEHLQLQREKMMMTTSQSSLAKELATEASSVTQLSFHKRSRSQHNLQKRIFGGDRNNQLRTQLETTNESSMQLAESQREYNQMINTSQSILNEPQKTDRPFTSGQF